MSTQEIPRRFEHAPVGLVSLAGGLSEYLKNQQYKIFQVGFEDGEPSAETMTLQEIPRFGDTPEGCFIARKDGQSSYLVQFERVLVNHGDDKPSSETWQALIRDCNLEQPLTKWGESNKVQLHCQPGQLELKGNDQFLEQFAQTFTNPSGK